MQNTVLVVEDDEIYRELVERHLGDAYMLVFTDSLRGAAEMLQSHIPDCILLDHRLPDGNGIDFLPQPVNAEVPVILCTAHGSEALAVKAIKAGAEDYLVKRGLGRRELRRAVRCAIKQSQLRTQLRLKVSESESLSRLLRTALSNNEALRGIIPICAYCRKVRDRTGCWHSIEAYVSQHTGARFTHGLCPSCLDIELEKFAQEDQARLDDENGERP
ncbi:MAG: response regulator [Candidatus Hydrogenedentes bacterium]|nr:response regulator [Candidatus Hydrogenedentota bacterium]